MDKYLEEFYNEYWRVPSKAEYENYSGIRIMHGEYELFLEENGLKPVMGKQNTIEAVNVETEETEFIGTVYDLAEEMDIAVSTIYCYLYNRKTINGIRFYIKPYIWK